MGCKLDRWTVYKFNDVAKGYGLIQPVEDLGNGNWIAKWFPAGRGGTFVINENEVYFYRDLADYN
jgi:hypothetical protein